MGEASDVLDDSPSRTIIKMGGTYKRTEKVEKVSHASKPLHQKTTPTTQATILVNPMFSYAFIASSGAFYSHICLSVANYTHDALRYLVGPKIDEV